MPTTDAIKQLANQELSKRFSLANRTQVAPRVQTMRAADPSIRSSLSEYLRDMVDDTGLGGGYRQGLLNAAGGVETAADFAPYLGGSLAMDDARKSFSQGDMIGTGINLLGVIPGIGKVASDAAKAGRSTLEEVRDLYFMHNTTPQALERYNALGGLPAPSIGVTRENVPFENFGEITLIGRPERFAPEADKANVMYAGDAYTIRAPDAFRMPMEDAPDRLRADYEPFESQEEYSVMEAETGAGYLERMLKQTNPSQDYNFFDNIFHSEAGLRKFARENDIPINPNESIRRVRDENYDLFNSWVEKEKDKYFTPGLYFDAASKNASKGKVVPFTNENIIPYMRKNKGAGTEETSTVGVGKIRASVQPEIKSLDQAREKKAMLQFFDSDEIGTKELFENKLLGLHDALEPYYKWPDGSFQMRNDVGTALSNAPRIGIRAALEREGFENVPDSLIPELEGFVSDLANAPTGYFESKPMRQVGFDEFSGAIVPSYAPESTLRLLESQGIPYEIYDDPTKGAFLGNEARLEARKKFRDSAFMLGGLGAGGAAYLNQEQQPGI